MQYIKKLFEVATVSRYAVIFSIWAVAFARSCMGLTRILLITAKARQRRALFHFIFAFVNLDTYSSIVFSLHDSIEMIFCRRRSEYSPSCGCPQYVRDICKGLVTRTTPARMKSRSSSTRLAGSQSSAQVCR